MRSIRTQRQGESPPHGSVTGAPAGDYWALPLDPELGGYLRTDRPDPHTNRILSLQRVLPYSSPSLLFQYSAIHYIIAYSDEFVKGKFINVHGKSILLHYLPNPYDGFVNKFYTSLKPFLLTKH